jgi:type I restriction enzyme S subunit
MSLHNEIRVVRPVRPVTFNQDIKAIIPNGIDGDFLYYALLCLKPRLLTLVEAAGHGTGVLPTEQLANLPITRLGWVEERAVATVLRALDDKIDLNRQMNTTLESMAQAILKDWFVDFGPTRAKIEGRAAYLAKKVWELFPDRIEDAGVPAGWRVRSLGDLIDVSPTESIQKGELAPYLDMAALPTQGSTTDLPILREYSSGTKFRNGDTLLARITPCLENGKTAFVHNLPSGKVAWGSTEFIVMRSIAPVPKPVSYLLARDPAFRRHAIQSMNGTSGRQRANTEAVARYPVCVPDDDRIWTALSSLLTPAFERISANAAEIQTLTETRDLLLPSLMAGTIGVKDTGAAIGLSK